MSQGGSKDGLCAIITGSASGLGAASAAILARPGARLLINYSSSQKEAEETADLCRKAGAEVAVVQGAARNFKITQPGDIELAEFYLGLVKA